MSVAFITGGNRGIGLGLVKQFIKHDYKVYTTYRDPERAEELLTLANSENVTPIQIDINDEEALGRTANRIRAETGELDLLINNAGINVKAGEDINKIHWSDVLTNFDTNVGGPFKTTAALFPLLQAGAGKKIVNMSSGMGSIAENSGGWTPYRVSKAALNMLTSNQALEFKSQGFIVIALDPGWVKTDMGGRGANLSVDESTTRMTKLILDLKPEHNGAFVAYDGTSHAF